MWRSALEVLVAPGCGHRLDVGAVHAEEGGELKDGVLVDSSCQRSVTVSNFIPRFTQTNGYAESFEEQWQRFPRTQLDRFNGTRLSHSRFFLGTGWTAEELRAQRVLEVGCGAGRFTEILLEAGADVYAFDATGAIDVCRTNVGSSPRVGLIQATLDSAPCRAGAFDKVFCYGVLQHLPQPKQAFLRLVSFLKPGGKLAIDVYRRSWRPSRWNAKYLWRPITTRMPRRLLFNVVKWYVPRWVDVENRLLRHRRLQELVASVVPCWNYTSLGALTPAQVKEWAVLDTFDALSPRYDLPQRLRDVRRWFEEANLVDIHVRFGGNGILGNARKPSGA